MSDDRKNDSRKNDSRKNDIRENAIRENADPLHGVTLRFMLEKLLVRGGWEGLAAKIPAKCFSENPSVKSSLNFLRRTPWARVKVERMYIRAFLGDTGKWYKTPTTLPPREDEEN